jgi:hypothetical protein
MKKHTEIWEDLEKRDMMFMYEGRDSRNGENVDIYLLSCNAVWTYR